MPSVGSPCVLYTQPNHIQPRSPIVTWGGAGAAQVRSRMATKYDRSNGSFHRVFSCSDSIPRWDATFSDALCKGCRWLWSSLYNILFLPLEDVHCVPLLSLEEDDGGEVELAGGAEGVLNCRRFIFTFEKCTLCPSSVSRRGWQPRGWTGRGAYDVLKCRRFIFTFEEWCFEMSSFHFYLWRMYFVSLSCVSKRMTAARLNWQGERKLFLKCRRFIFTFEGCTLCPSPVSRRGWQPRGWTGSESRSCFKMSSFIFTSEGCILSPFPCLEVQKLF